MSSPVESFSVNSSCLPPATMYDFWRDCTSPLFSAQPLTDTVNYQGFITSYAAQGLVATHVGFENQVICRTPEQVRRDGSDFLLLQYYQNGKQVGYLDNGFPLENHGGVITLQDYAHAYQSVGHSNNNYGILIPRNLIEYRNTIYENRPVVTWDRSSLNGARLLGSIKVFFSQLAQENSLQDIHLARDHLVTVVNQHLGSLFKGSDSDVVKKA